MTSLQVGDRYMVESDVVEVFIIAAEAHSTTCLSLWGVAKIVCIL